MDTRQVLLDYCTSPARQLETDFSYTYRSRFFVPKPKFVEWCLKNYPNYNWVDCGCGQGHVAKLLEDNGFDVLAIDLYPPDETVTHVLQMCAPMFPFGRNTVGMICRPCRGGWIHATIIKIVESGCPCVYVGKESHFDTDLAPLPYKVELALEDVGEEGENLWLVSL